MDGIVSQINSNGERKVLKEVEYKTDCNKKPNSKPELIQSLKSRTIFLVFGIIVLGNELNVEDTQHFCNKEQDDE